MRRLACLTRSTNLALRPVAAAALALAAGAALAQPSASAPTQRVEVIAPAPLPGLEIARDQVPAPVQVLRADALSQGGDADLATTLNRRLGGVYLNDVQGNPFQADVNYRGFTASPLLGTAQGLSVYLDGLRLNQPFGDVVSWDLIPKNAIAQAVLMPGANPLFGLNTLGGALALQTKDGLRHAGTVLHAGAGSHGRASLGFEHGGHQAGGEMHWYLAGQQEQTQGWRTDSASRVGQVFGKLGLRRGATDFTLSAALAETRMNGNGLQEQRLLDADHRSVYTRPDTTRNRSALVNLAATTALSDHLRLTTQLHARTVRTRALNADINEDSLDQSVYQPSAADQAALAAAGYSGYPASGATAANTPFPKWRCIAQALQNDEPAEKCNGLITRGSTHQAQWGLSAQLAGEVAGPVGTHRWVLGAAHERSRISFHQLSELGYLNADRTVTGVGAFADGLSGGDIDGEPFDTQVRLRSRSHTSSVYASDTVALNPRTHLTLAARYNRSVVHTLDELQPQGGTGSLNGDHVFARVNPALGLTWAATPAVTLYAGANQGSRAPSAIELGCADPDSPCKLPNSMAGDPPLRQVVTTNLEAGLRGRTAAGLSWNVGVFRADNKDDILFVADNAAGFGYFKNFGKTRRQGLEAGFSAGVPGWQGASVGAQLTLLDATFRSTEVLGGAGNSSNNEAVDEGLPGVDGTITVQPGHRIPLTPRRQLKLFAEAPIAAGWTASVDVVAMSGAYARGNENNAHQPDGTYYLGAGRSAGYALANAGLAWQPTAALRVGLQVNNLFDRRYATAAQLGATGFDAKGNFVARPFPANAEGDRPLVGSTFYAPGAPRSVALTVRYAI
ncbi:TonB-dependent receptor [Ideonella sp. DXS22W]|uniref:TonB-dependent receptor n=1 Tax=Pseudaquabacterium inlustre TaxID=2984192 RepID=A0ABU9CBU2_9BURK